MDEPLSQFRKEIDEIDKSILNLLAKRFDIVKQVGEWKKQNQKCSSYMRPGREAVMMTKLIDNASDFLPASATYSIWRSLIAAATAAEQKNDIAIAVFSSKNLSNLLLLSILHYQNIIPVLSFDGLEDIEQLSQDNPSWLIVTDDFACNDNCSKTNIANIIGSLNRNGFHLVAKLPSVISKGDFTSTNIQNYQDNIVSSDNMSGWLWAHSEPEPYYNDDITILFVNDYQQSDIIRDMLNKKHITINQQINLTEQNAALLVIDGFWRESDLKSQSSDADFMVIGGFGKV